MAISLVCGLAAGLAFMFLRESLISGGKSEIWTTINDLLFQDITAEGAERSFGIFYIVGQLFIKALQLVIIPMVFTSIALAIGSIADTRTMGRISAKTLFWFLLCSFLALLLASSVGYITFSMGLFNTHIEGLTEASGSTGSNPLNVVLNIIPSNIITAFGSNGAVLSAVFLAVATGLSMNALGESRTATLRRPPAFLPRGPCRWRWNPSGGIRGWESSPRPGRAYCPSLRSARRSRSGRDVRHLLLRPAERPPSAAPRSTASDT